MKKVFISLGNENPSDNKIILDGKELNLSGIGYFALECNGIEKKWIYASQKPELPSEIELLIKQLKDLGAK